MHALAFSGGKDSLACWYLRRPPLVLYVNTGKVYPETRLVVDRIAAQCERFVEIHSHQERQNAVEGLPSDLVPIDCTQLGQRFSGSTSIRVQSYLGCCYENIAMPLLNKAKELGVTHLLYGQRADEHYKSPARHGDIIEGIVREHPIEQWTSGEVLAYLRSMGDCPEHFAIEHSSLDCYDCTAYAAHSADRIAYTREHHPGLYAKWRARMNDLRGAMDQTMAAYARFG